MLKRAVIRWLIGIISMFITAAILNLLPPQYQLKWNSIWGIVVFVPVLALVNAVIGTVLRLLSMPITCMTLGLFSFVINAIIFWIAGSATGAHSGKGAPIGFIVSLIGSILYTLISAPISALVRESH